MILEFKDILPAVHTKKKSKEQVDILNMLFNALADNPAGNALACNQIGINDSRIVVTMISDVLYFINPEITSKSKEMFSIPETCLSLPNKMLKTKRYKWIEVKAENFKEPIIFGDYDGDVKFRTVRLNQTSALQKVLDVLDGISILDNQTKYNQIPIILNNKKLGRNEVVALFKGNETKKIKYKFIEPLLEDGWVLIENEK